MAQRGINKVILVGRLGKDPEVRYMPNGNAVASLTLATSETWKDKNTGQQQDKTEWHRIVMFRRLAEIAGEYLKKGSQIYIEGKLQTRKWQDQNGQDRYTTEIIADELQMLGGRNSAATEQQPEPNTPTPSAQPAPAAQGPAPGFDDFDDDIPF